MKKIKRVLLVSLWLLTIPCLAASDVQIFSAAFGVFDASKENELRFQPRSVVPHQVAQRYGWVITLTAKKRRVSVREEYLLPAKPQTEADKAAGIIPLERRNQVSQRQLAINEGQIYGEWSVGPNEPAGHRHLQVFVEGELAGDFEFDVR